jgi:xylulokinase
VSDYRKTAVLGLDLGLGASGASGASGISGASARVLGPDDALRGPAVGFSQSRAEADPADWWLAAVRAVREAHAAAGVEITGLAVACQLPGVVLVDDRGAALRRAILGPAAPILAWLAVREPHTLRAAWWALSPRDWLRLRLTGQAVTGPVTASGLPDDSRLGGVPRGLLPPARDPAALSGPLLPGPAAELRLRPGIPVTAGPVRACPSGAGRPARAAAARATAAPRR